MGKEVLLTEKEICMLRPAINARIEMRKEHGANSKAEKRQIEYCNEMLWWFQHSCVFLKNPYAQALLTGIIQEHLVDRVERSVLPIKNKYSSESISVISNKEKVLLNEYNEIINLYNRIALRKYRKNLITLNHLDSNNKG
ncbi:MAG: hypothetical protein AB7V36_01470 [Bacteroidales bacterium]